MRARGRSDGILSNTLGAAARQALSVAHGPRTRRGEYDSTPGQSTQQDPIGIAGGANVYGFADGDPVNYSDPFGLCPVVETGIPCAVVFGAGGAAIGGVAGAVAGATGGTMVAPGVGTVGGAVAGAGAGAELGLMVGAAVGTAVDVAYSIDWGKLGRKILTGAAVVGGLVISGGNVQVVKPVADRVRAEQEAQRRKGESEAEAKGKKKGTRGDGSPPDKDPPE